jgi:hypothetical protein
MTKLNSALPKGSANGLDALADQLLDSPHTIHVVVALVDCKDSKTDYDTGDVVPTARIRRVEPITGADKDLAGKLLRRALALRLGETVLPFDLEEDLRAAFGDFDGGTGEIRGNE